MGHKKDEYHKLTSLYVKQKWLIPKKDELKELIEFCGDNDSKDLILSLLERFSYLENDTLGMLLNEIADYIIIISILTAAVCISSGFYNTSVSFEEIVEYFISFLKK